MTDVLSQRVADLAALTQAQRDALRALAAADPSEAEDRLQMSLRRWSEPMLRRYIADVLVGGARAPGRSRSDRPRTGSQPIGSPGRSRSDRRPLLTNSRNAAVGRPIARP